MFHHIVMLRLSGIDEEFISRVDEYVVQLRAELPFVRSYAFVRNQARRALGYDWTVISSFASSEDHDRYQISDIHQKIQAFMEPHIEALIVCDAAVGTAA